jgi:predicted nucleotidyltransferase
MHLFPDFKDLLAAFESARVRYVLLGGYAVIFYGRPRATKDIDVLVSLDEENRERIAEALANFGAPENVVDAARKMTAEDVVYFGVNPMRVDILGSASGVDFDGVFARAITTSLDGVTVPIIALADLIANKRASGRPRDLEDCAELERIAARAPK